MITGVALVLLVFVVVGSSTVEGVLFLAGLVVLIVGFLEAFGLFYLLNLFPEHARRDGAPGTSRSEVVVLMMVSILGVISFFLSMQSSSRTLYTLLVMGLGGGLMIGAGRQVFETLRRG